MTKRFRDSNLDQMLLLPLSLHDWLPENHLARFVAEVMKELNTSPLFADYEGEDGRGLAAYDPVMMTRVLLYGYCVGVTSSRRIERATHEDVAFRYLAANQHPDHDTIANFRRPHLKILADFFLEVLRLCREAGLVKLGNVAIDGTKILAHASTRRSVPYKKLQQREEHWKKVIADLLAAAEQTDTQEDATGKDSPPIHCRPNSRTPRAAWKKSVRPKRCWKKKPGKTWKKWNDSRKHGSRLVFLRMLRTTRVRPPAPARRRRRIRNVVAIAPRSSCTAPAAMPLPPAGSTTSSIPIRAS
jgi:transposase